MVDPWFVEFTIRLKDRIRRTDFPPPASEWWETLRKALIISGATEDIADAASERLAMQGISYLDAIIPELKKLIGVIFRERERAGDGISPDSREGAEAESRGCPDCGGQGLTIRFRHTPDAKPESVACYCVCPMGRWIEKKSTDVHHRTIDLARVRFLQLGPVPWSDEPDNKHRYRREQWDFDRDRPKDGPTFRSIVDNHKAALRGLTLDASDKARVPRQAAPPTAPAGVPAGLTPSQEIFLFTLGDHWRGRLRSLPPEDQAEILADFRDGVENERLISAQRRIAASA